MTMPYERTRALLWGGSFLVEMARDNSLPLSLRRRAVIIARHFPTIEDVSTMAIMLQSGLGCELARPDEVPDWKRECPAGALTYSTSLEWPEDP